MIKKYFILTLLFIFTSNISGIKKDKDRINQIITNSNLTGSLKLGASVGLPGANFTSKYTYNIIYKNEEIVGYYKMLNNKFNIEFTILNNNYTGDIKRILSFGELPSFEVNIKRNDKTITGKIYYENYNSRKNDGVFKIDFFDIDLGEYKIKGTIEHKIFNKTEQKKVIKIVYNKNELNGEQFYDKSLKSTFYNYNFNGNKFEGMYTFKSNSYLYNFFSENLSDEDIFLFIFIDLYNTIFLTYQKK